MTVHTPHTSVRHRYPSEQELAWTPRQREVLALVAAGRTNAEIAERLALSLDGAKWHVREIMSKLQVDNREEAADYWRRRNGIATRLTRYGAGILSLGKPLTLLKAAAVGVAGVVTVSAIAAGVVALRSSTDNDAQTTNQPGAAAALLPPAAQKLADLYENKDVNALMALSAPTEITCNEPIDGPYPLCTGAGEGEHRSGFRIAQHGGDGEAVDASVLRQRLLDAVALEGGPASLGCPAGLGSCDRFILAFANPVDSPQRVFYIAAETRSGEPSLIGIGSSGDNADVFLDGGQSMTPFGLFDFTRP